MLNVFELTGDSDLTATVWHVLRQKLANWDRTAQNFEKASF